MKSDRKFLDKNGIALLYADLRKRIASVSLGHEKLLQHMRAGSSKGSIEIGENSKSNSENQLVFGKNNAEDVTAVEIVGWGTPDVKKNIKTLDTNGNLWVMGDIKAGGNSPTEGTSIIVQSISDEEILALFKKK